VTDARVKKVYADRVGAREIGETLALFERHLPEVELPAIVAEERWCAFSGRWTARSSTSSRL
jgi:hypothetical protein